MARAQHYPQIIKQSTTHVSCRIQPHNILCNALQPPPIKGKRESEQKVIPEDSLTISLCCHPWDKWSEVTRA